MTRTHIIILAAGAGTRTRSALPKPLLPLAGKPLVAHVLAAARRISADSITVVTPAKSAMVADAVAGMDARAVCVPQPRPLGMADAARRALPKIAGDGTAIILCADAPLLPPERLRQVRRAAAKRPAFLTFIAADAGAYGRIVRGGKNTIARVTEARDADAATLQIKEVFSGCMAAPLAWLRDMLPKISRQNAAGEYYLTELAALAAAQGNAAAAVVAPEEDCLGVNTAADLERAAGVLRRRRAGELLARGVRLADAARVEFAGEVRAGRDVDIGVNVVFAGRVALADGCVIGANCVLRDCRIGAGTIVEPFSYLADCRIGARCQIGPYARLRQNAVAHDGARIGNFTEIKNSALGAGAKAAHLAYVGDAAVGKAANIGAGAITCNYDGRAKHRTVIGDGAFIGSNAQLVAPVKIGRNAYVAAGSTITESVPDETLAIARARQETRPRQGARPRQARPRQAHPRQGARPRRR